MTEPEPEPRSETPEKKSIRKTHEEYIGDEAQPSLSKQEYEKAQRERQREKTNNPSDQRP